MATIMHDHSPEQARENSRNGILMALFILLILAALLVAYGLPSMKGGNRDSGTGEQPDSSVNVPDRVDVNVNTTP